MAAKPVRDPHLHMALGPKHILAQAGTLLAGTLAVANPSIPKPARKCRILVSTHGISTCLLDTAPGNTYRVRMEGTIMVVLSMSGLVMCPGHFVPPVGTLKHHMQETAAMAVTLRLEMRMPIPRGRRRRRIQALAVMQLGDRCPVDTSTKSGNEVCPVSAPRRLRRPRLTPFSRRRWCT